MHSGDQRVRARVAESLYRKVTSDGTQSVTAAIFWLKTRGGWKETNIHEMSGPPPTIQIRWVDAKL